MNVIYVEFSWQTEIRYARQVVMERLATVPMPPGIRPQMTPPASIMGQILHVGLHRRQGPRGGQLAPIPRHRAGCRARREGWPATSYSFGRRYRATIPDFGSKYSRRDVHWEVSDAPRTVAFMTEAGPQSVTFRTPLEDRMDLRTTSDWVIRPRLLRLSGIAEVIVMGGDVKQYQVLVDPAEASRVQRLAARDRNGDRRQQPEYERRVSRRRPERTPRPRHRATGPIAGSRFSMTC